MPCIYKRGNLAMVKMIGRHGHENRIMDLFRQDPDVHFVLRDTYEQVIGGSDLVISAITKVTENFVTDEYFKEGCTVIPICTMGFQNCDLFFDRVFTDEIEQIRGFKYFDHFAPVTTNVTDVLNGAGPAAGRPADTHSAPPPSSRSRSLRRACPASPGRTAAVRSPDSSGTGPPRPGGTGP